MQRAQEASTWTIKDRALRNLFNDIVQYNDRKKKKLLVVKIMSSILHSG